MKTVKIYEMKLSTMHLGDLIGGNVCYCSCYWQEHGGSSVESNRNANHEHGYSSEHGCNDQYMEDGCPGTVVCPGGCTA